MADLLGRALRSAAGTVAVAVAIALTSVAPAAAFAPARGPFAGTTTQQSGAHTALLAAQNSDVSFRVAGSRVRSFVIAWRASCQSGSVFTDSTSGSSIPLVRNRWSRPGSYQFAFPPGMTARVTILKETGQFTSPITASGIWSASATIYRGAQQVDTCASGTIRWGAGSLASGRHSSLIVPASRKIGGLTLAQWAAKNWQWKIAQLRSYPSPNPHERSCVTAEEPGRVLFADGDLDPLAFNVTATCTVLRGRYLFIGYPSIDCSTVEAAPFHATTDAGLLACARSFEHPKSSLCIDGTVVSPSGVPVATKAFSFTMPAANNWLQAPAGPTSGRAAVVGQALMVRPLSPGWHTIVRVDSFGGPTYTAILHLRVL